MNKKNLLILALVACVVTILIVRKDSDVSSVKSEQSLAGDALDPIAAQSWPSSDRTHGRTRPTATSDEPDTDPLVGASDPFRAECWEQCGSQCSLDSKGIITCPPTCDDDNECEDDELCTMTRSFANRSRRLRRCLKDQCSGRSSHDECGDNRACIYAGRMEGGIYRCAMSGIRKDGEPCAHDEYPSIGLCERGLSCGNGICTRDVCETDDDCGPGARCQTIAGGEDLRSCIAMCDDDDDCPAGMTCDGYTNSSLPVPKRCISPENMGCLASPCDEGLECIVNKDEGSYAITSCMRPCSEKCNCSVPRQAYETS